MCRDAFSRVGQGMLTEALLFVVDGEGSHRLTTLASFDRAVRSYQTGSIRLQSCGMVLADSSLFSPLSIHSSAIG
jgi:hypothetical protein